MVTLRLLVALLLSGFRSRHTSLGCHAGRCIGRYAGVRGRVTSSLDVTDFVAALDQAVDAERGGGEVLQECVQIRGEETSEPWQFLLIVSSRRIELQAHPLRVLFERSE